MPDASKHVLLVEAEAPLRHAVAEQRRLRMENAYLRAQLEQRYSFAGVIGKSRAMTQLFQLLEPVASTSSTILITGETGTGRRSSPAPSTRQARASRSGSWR